MVESVLLSKDKGVIDTPLLYDNVANTHQWQRSL